MAIPKVSIELDKERYMSFTLGAMCDFKKETGLDISDVGENMTPEQIRVFLWAVLRVHDKGLTLEDVGDMIHIGNLAEIVEKLTTLAQDNSPEAPPGGEAKNQNPPTG